MNSTWTIRLLGQLLLWFEPLHIKYFFIFSLIQEKPQGSVFSRLGGLASPPATATATVQAVNPRIRPPSSDDYPEDIDYTSHSVLKPVKRKGVPAKPVKPVKPVKRSTGLTSDEDAGKSVFARLGSKVWIAFVEGFWKPSVEN